MSDAHPQPSLAAESIAGQRPYQEDAVLTETLPDGRILVAVADGMGGHAAGEVASALALESLVESVQDGQGLPAAFRLANQRVRSKAKEPDKKGMGTTLVVMLLDGDTYRVANVGDSRGYLLSAQGIEQLTQDHSFVEEAVERGQSREEAETSQWKDALTRSIGTDEKVEADVFGPFEVEPDTAVLLCSDGLYKALSDQEVKEIYIRSGSVGGAAQSLVTAALEGGSDDNISVAIAEFGQVPREQPAGTMEFEWEGPEDADEDEGARDSAPPADEEPAAVEGAGEMIAPRGLPWGIIAVAVVIVLAAVVGIWMVTGGG